MVCVSCVKQEDRTEGRMVGDSKALLENELEEEGLKDAEGKELGVFETEEDEEVEILDEEEGLKRREGELDREGEKE